MNTKNKHFSIFALSLVAIVSVTGCKAVVTVDPSTASLEAGNTLSLEATSTARRDDSFAWTSADTAIATVDQSGTVTGVNDGQTTITARGDSSGAEGVAVITVWKAVVTVDPSTASLEAGDTISLTATSTSGHDNSFVWTSADTAIATVDQSGTVTGVNDGQTTITAQGNSSGAEGLAVITVWKAVVTVDPSTASLEAGNTISLTATSTSGHDNSFVWASADTAIATVDQSGTVTGVNDGQTTITARGNSSGAEGQADITVTRPPDVLSAFSLKVAPEIIPEVTSLPPLTEGGESRPVAVIVDERGNQAEFVENELILVTDDLDALYAFIARWEGEYLWELDASETDIDMPQMHLVKINTALGNPSELTEADILAIDPDARGASQVSSDAGLRLISASAREAASGAAVGINWLAKGDSLTGRSTTEAATGPDGFNSDGSGYTPNAFDWNFLDTDSAQDIGVTEAWYLLAKTGKLSNKVKIAILDMGFSVSGNTDIPSGWQAISNVPFTNPVGTSNLLGCSGGNSCPWHGTEVLCAAMGVPDNSFGGAGPAGPVADPIMVFTLYDFFTSISAIVEARALGARVLNMSYGTPVPAILSFSVLPFEIATAAAKYSMVMTASAGNQGKNVDAEDCFIVCWEETWWTPCENNGVTCVGGLRKDSKYRDSGSNYGGEEVDIFAPYSVIAGPTPANSDAAHQVNGTSFASPYVAGVAALVFAAKPSLSASQVRDILSDTAHSSPDSKVERYVDAEAAVSKALGALIIIESPETGDSIHGNFPVYFDAFVHDAGRGAATVQWSSSRDGSLGSGLHISATDLSYGTHVIRALATFPDASTVENTVTITVVNDPPTVTITSPENGDSYYQGQPVLLAATSYDINEPGAQLTDNQISWYVDNVYKGHNHTRTITAGALSVGTHTIKVVGTDGTSSDTETVSITTLENPLDLPPDEVNITSPVHGSYFGGFRYESGSWYLDMLLEGNAHDPEDGNLTGASLVWTARVNGGPVQTLGTGESVTRETPVSEGSYTYDITLTAKDSADNTTSATVQATLIFIAK